MCWYLHVSELLTYYNLMVHASINSIVDLGVIVREARKKQGLTQAKLATEVGVSREWLSGVERGSRPRAELEKVLATLTALDLPLFPAEKDEARPLGNTIDKLTDSASNPEDSGKNALPNTTEVTRLAATAARAIHKTTPTIGELRKKLTEEQLISSSTEQTNSYHATPKW